MTDTQSVKPNLPPRKPTGAPTASRPAEHISAEDLRAGAQREPEHEAPRVRRRLRSSDTLVDEFYIPIEEIPDHLTYEWKRWSVNGAQDPFYIARLREQGFDPVPPSRHPNWLPPGYNEPYIIKGGQILMDRPKELTEEARAEDRARARTQITVAEQKLGRTPKGTMTRDYDGARPSVQKEYGRMVPTVEE